MKKLLLLPILLFALLIVPVTVRAEQLSCGDGVHVSVGVPGAVNKGTTTDPYYCVSGGSGSNNVIYSYIKGVIKFFAGLVGIAVVINIIIGGIQYTASQGDPTALKNAKTRIFNAVLSLIVFLFAATIINYIIPGGVLS